MQSVFAFNKSTSNTSCINWAGNNSLALDLNIVAVRVSRILLFLYSFSFYQCVEEVLVWYAVKYLVVKRLKWNEYSL